MVFRSLSFSHRKLRVAHRCPGRGKASRTELVNFGVLIDKGRELVRGKTVLTPEEVLFRLNLPQKTRKFVAAFDGGIKRHIAVVSMDCAELTR